MHATMPEPAAGHDDSPCRWRPEPAVRDGSVSGGSELGDAGRLRRCWRAPHRRVVPGAVV